MKIQDFYRENIQKLEQLALLDRNVRAHQK